MSAIAYVPRQPEMLRFRGTSAKQIAGWRGVCGVFCIPIRQASGGSLHRRTPANRSDRQLTQPRTDAVRHARRAAGSSFRSLFRLATVPLPMLTTLDHAPQYQRTHRTV